MLRVEHRQMFRPNGLIDDLVLYGTPADYLEFASQVEAAIGSPNPITLATESHMHVEISDVGEFDHLFTSLQNQEDDYPSMESWAQRDTLRVLGSGRVLETLRQFLVDLSQRGVGYSYISEYSEQFKYATNSPEWRLHVIHE